MERGGGGGGEVPSSVPQTEAKVDKITSALQSVCEAGDLCRGHGRVLFAPSLLWMVDVVTVVGLGVGRRGGGGLCFLFRYCL